MKTEQDLNLNRIIGHDKITAFCGSFIKDHTPEKKNESNFIITFHISLQIKPERLTQQPHSTPSDPKGNKMQISLSLKSSGEYNEVLCDSESHVKAM